MVTFYGLFGSGCFAPVCSPFFYERFEKRLAWAFRSRLLANSLAVVMIGTLELSLSPILRNELPHPLHAG